MRKQSCHTSDTVSGMTDLLAQLRTAARAIDRAENRRADLIRQARAAGHSWRDIGQAAGISHTWARRVGKV